MQKWFGSSSNAIQLSSDDEDDHNRRLSFGFGGCMSCLPRLNLNGGGNVRLSENGATLDDYLDADTATTINPLLDEDNNRDREDAFGGAVLQNSQRFLTRNPFASATITTTTIAAAESTGSTKSITASDNNSGDGDSSQEQAYHSFSVAAPRVDFFMEGYDDDDGDADFLSDHRISAVIGDTGKLASQFKIGKHLQGDGDSTTSNITGNQHDNRKNATTKIQTFERESSWSDDVDLDTTDTTQQPQLYHDNKIDSNQLQQDELREDSGTSVDILFHANDPLCGFEHVEHLSSKTMDNDNGSLLTSADAEYQIINRETNDYAGTNSNQDNIDQVESTETDITPIAAVYTHETEFARQHSYSRSDTALAALSEPSSPVPAPLHITAEKSYSKFPSVGLPRDLTPTRESTPTPLIHRTLAISTQKQSIENPHRSKNSTESPIISSSPPTMPGDTDNRTSSYMGTTVGTGNNMTGKRRPSVAAVAHSLLGDKLDDFTEKLTYIRKNIISTLDDSDNNDDQDTIKSNQRQQLWRPRSSSMLQNSQRQPPGQLYSATSEKPQQQQLSKNNPRMNDRRSNSMVNTSSSFSKFFQQISGASDSESTPRKFGSSSFFATLDGHGTSTDSPMIPPNRSSFSSQLGQHHQHPKRSRSTSALATSPQSSIGIDSSSSSLHGVDVQQEMDQDDLFEFRKVIAVGKNVQNISEDLMANGIRLFNDFSTRMKNANADRLGQEQTPSSSFITTAQQLHHSQQPRQQQQSTNDGFFI